MSLFRPEVFEHRRFRLRGVVVLTDVTSNWVLVALLVAVTATTSGWIATGRYTRTERVVGRITPDGALTRIVPTRPGVVVRLFVKEGEAVVTGQSLAAIEVAQASQSRANPSAQDLARKIHWGLADVA